MEGCTDADLLLLGVEVSPRQRLTLWIYLPDRSRLLYRVALAGVAVSPGPCVHPSSSLG